jgi:hypothetical protein
MLTEAEIQAQLGRAFAPEQAAVLAEIIAATLSVAALSGQMAALGETVERLAAAQTRTEERLEALVAAQARAEERLERVESAVERLAAAQTRTEEQFREMAAAQARTEKELAALAAAQRRTETRLGALNGRALESTYRERAGSYFGRLLRRIRVVAPNSLEDALEARVTPEEFQDVLLLDLLVAGRPREAAPEAEEVLLAVEVSAVVDVHDVQRARQRAAILRRAGYRAVPAVAGERLTAGAERAARAVPVLVVQDGHTRQWTEALAGSALAGSD